ncbi:SRPBCC family protein [Adhaeribacter sp. BT258]|uniref:SRPBCC family protein n=1 Tax=Adhaeribacter terrigena TaxID=2793070 RepID=A0ABS1BWN5_9BACT|nr:SRPBCC family protein [Adhaeribacter terrigena]MBK0401536.1 SRPBCC family protein [Adhaeribacter terrigena]
MPTNQTPVVETQMLIRKPAAQVFQAFTDPEITRNFWFTQGSGKLETGKTITWEWEMYGVSAEVLVKEIQLNERILIEWGEPATSVEFNFKTLSENATYVTIRNYGFHQTGPELLNEIKDATGGFTTVLDGCKAFLEHGINLNLIADKFPKEVTPHP